MLSTATETSSVLLTLSMLVRLYSSPSYGTYSFVFVMIRVAIIR